jgi:hypothetical protein
MSMSLFLMTRLALLGTPALVLLMFMVTPGLAAARSGAVLACWAR